MVRSSNLSEGMRDLAEQGSDQARRMAEFGVFGMRDFAEHNVGQAKQAFDGFLGLRVRFIVLLCELCASFLCALCVKSFS